MAGESEDEPHEPRVVDDGAGAEPWINLDGALREVADALGPGRRTRSWAEVLLERLGVEEVADLDRPHLVLCCHVATGVTSYQGPYPNALTALVAAQEEHQALSRAGEEDAVSFSVAPLFSVDPPLPRAAPLEPT